MFQKSIWLSAVVCLMFAIGVIAHQPAEAQGGKPFALEEFFNGPISASGSSTNLVNGQARRFTMNTRASASGNQITIRDTLTFSDNGERDSAQWTITKTGDGRYSGTRTHSVGAASIRTGRNGLVWKYVLDLPKKDGSGSRRLNFEELMYMRGDGSVMRRTAIKKFGVTLGRIEIVYRRAG